MAVPPPHPLPDKTTLRRSLRQTRAAFVASLDAPAMAGLLAAIERHLAPLLRREGPIAGYVAHRGEVDVLPFLIAAHHLGHTIALPHIAESAGTDNSGRDGRRAMHFARWRPDAALAPGHAGILQPVSDGKPLLPAILLTPLVGFDRGGRRLGQGGGFYDRWFADHPRAMRVGVAWSVQEAPRLPVDPWDMPLHAIVTEKEWITP